MHRRYDTPAYYVASGWIVNGHNVTYPMYEKYFDSSIVLTDTFYLGATQHTIDGRLAKPHHIGFRLLSCRTDGIREYQAYYYCWSDKPAHWVFPNHNYPPSSANGYLLIFPILTPEPSNNTDSTGVGGDTTLAVTTPTGLLGRYVTVHPNPAAGEAQVLSSFGLSHIEALDASGHPVLSRDVSGYEARLDLSSWPQGLYLLRIQTPIGTATKKLLVR